MIDLRMYSFTATMLYIQLVTHDCIESIETQQNNVSDKARGALHSQLGKGSRPKAESFFTVRKVELRGF